MARSTKVLLTVWIALLVVLLCALTFFFLDRQAKRRAETELKIAQMYLQAAVDPYSSPETGEVPDAKQQEALAAAYETAQRLVREQRAQSAEQGENCVVVWFKEGGGYAYVLPESVGPAPTAPPAAEEPWAEVPAVPPAAEVPTPAPLPQITTPPETLSPSSVPAVMPVSPVAETPGAPVFGIGGSITTLQAFYHETQLTNPIECLYVDAAASGIVSALPGYTFWCDGIDGDDDRDETEVSIAALKDLSSYAVVILHGHGGHSDSIGSFLATCIPYSDTLYRDWTTGRIIVFNDGSVGVTSKFFDKYLAQNASENALIYLGACSSGKDSRLADSFLSKGFSCALGNSKTVSRLYNLCMIRSFFDAMDGVNGIFCNAADALEYAKSLEGRTDPYNGSHAEVLLFGNGEVTFQSVYPPTPTISPSPGAAETPALSVSPGPTSTPTPTPSPAPAILPINEQQSDPLYPLYAAYIRKHYVEPYGIVSWDDYLGVLSGGDVSDSATAAAIGVVSISLGDFDGDDASEAVVFYSYPNEDGYYILHMVMLDEEAGVVVPQYNSDVEVFSVDVDYFDHTQKELTVSICKTANAGDYIQTKLYYMGGDFIYDTYELFHLAHRTLESVVRQPVFCSAHEHYLILRDSVPPWMTGDFHTVPYGINPYWSEEEWDPSDLPQDELCIYAGGRDAGVNATGHLNENGIKVYRPETDSEYDSPEQFLFNDVYASPDEALRAILQPVDGAATAELLFLSGEGRNAIQPKAWLGME